MFCNSMTLVPNLHIHLVEVVLLPAHPSSSRNHRILLGLLITSRSTPRCSVFDFVRPHRNNVQDMRAAVSSATHVRAAQRAICYTYVKQVFLAVVCHTTQFKILALLFNELTNSVSVWQLGLVYTLLSWSR